MPKPPWHPDDAHFGCVFFWSPPRVHELKLLQGVMIRPHHVWWQEGSWHHLLTEEIRARRSSEAVWTTS